MSSVPPVSGPPSGFSSKMPSWLQNLTQLWQKYQKDLMPKWEKDPSKANTEALQKCLSKIEKIVEDHKKDLQSEARAHGWPQKGLYNIDNYIKGLKDAIQGFKDKPNGASLDLANEQLTQIIDESQQPYPGS